jgi:hypothetical protein
MSDHHNDPCYWAGVYLDAACQEAGKRFPAGAESVPPIVCGYMAAAAIIHQAGCIESKLDEIAESLDCLAARPDDEAKPLPSSYESAVMVASLKASWLKMNPEHTEAQYTAAMRRFEQLAGL